jgi:protoporphyrinogen oxidase
VKRDPVIIVGAGLAGLTCALALEARGLECVILEQSDGVGGRVRTDLSEEGFRLDRGFQVLLPSYSECRRWLDYEALNLKSFHAGALVQRDDGRHTLGDPLKEPAQLLATTVSPVGTLSDKMKALKLRAHVAHRSYEEFLEEEPLTSESYLRSQGFSDGFMEDFWRPFFSGIFLEEKLETHAGFLRYLYQTFASAPVCVPEMGMGEIPKQLAAKLSKTEIRFNHEVESLTASGVTLVNGTTLRAHAVVCAADGPAASRLMGGAIPAPASLPVTTAYFAAPVSPIDGPWLLLNSYRRTPPRLVNHVAVMSEASASYSPDGRALVSCNVLGIHAGLESETITEDLVRIFGPEAREWRHLRTYRIAHALPAFRQKSPVAHPLHGSGIYICGDHVETPSIQGAMLSGRLTAEAIAP